MVCKLRNFAITILMKEIIDFVFRDITGLNGSFVKEVQVFVKQLFLSGQNDLQSRDHGDKDHGDKDPQESGAKKNVVNKFKLSVLSNAVCVDILVWATKDENGKFDTLELEKAFGKNLSGKKLYN